MPSRMDRVVHAGSASPRFSLMDSEVVAGGSSMSELHQDSRRVAAAAAAAPLNAVQQQAGLYAFGGASSSNNGWTEQQQHVPAGHAWQAHGLSTGEQASALLQNNTPALAGAAEAYAGALPNGDLFAGVSPSCATHRNGIIDGSNNGSPTSIPSYSPEGMMPAPSISDSLLAGMLPVGDEDYVGSSASIGGCGASGGVPRGAPDNTSAAFDCTSSSHTPVEQDAAWGVLEPSSTVASKPQPKKKLGRPRVPKKKGKPAVSPAPRRVPRKIKRPRPPEVGLGAGGRERVMGLLRSLVDSPLSDEFHKPVVQLHPEVCLSICGVCAFACIFRAVCVAL